MKKMFTIRQKRSNRIPSPEWLTMDASNPPANHRLPHIEINLRTYAHKTCVCEKFFVCENLYLENFRQIFAGW